MQQMQNSFQVAATPTASYAAPSGERFQVYYESPNHEEGKYM